MPHCPSTIFICSPVWVFLVNKLLVQVRDGSIDVRPRLVALDVKDHKAHFSDGTSEHVRLLDAVTAHLQLCDCVSRYICTTINSKHASAQRHHVRSNAANSNYKCNCFKYIAAINNTNQS